MDWNEKLFGGWKPILWFNLIFGILFFWPLLRDRVFSRKKDDGEFMLELPVDRQKSIENFLSDHAGFDDFYMVDGGRGNLLSLEDCSGRKVLDIKSIAVLPSCEGFLGKLSGWFGKSNFHFKSHNKNVFSSGFLQMRRRSDGLNGLGIYSESCEKNFSIEEKCGNPLDVLISENRFSYSCFLTPDRKIAAAVFDDKLNCMLHLSPCETVPGLMQTRPRICVSKHLTDKEKTCLSIIAMVGEINDRANPNLS